ncbi:MAG TPA: DoxX family membrane protein [Acidimicrobiales bacterium]|nr:DoxX family membrane protein [Acidimicrobiales bacterium]
MKVTRRLAQAALGVPFIWLGYEAASEPGGRVGAAEQLGIPSAETAVRFNGAAMVAGGAALVANVLPRAAAAGLIVSLVPTTLAGHAFWKMDPSDPARTVQRIQVLKNLALTGALAEVALHR